MDCYGRAQNAAEESKYKKAEEKVKLAVMGSYGIDGNLDDGLLKENLNNIDGLEQKVADASRRPLYIVVDSYPFTIGKLGEVTGERELADIDENTEAGKEVKIDDKWKTKEKRYVDTTNGKEEEIVETASVYAVSDGEGNKVPVPYDFYYVGGTLETGIVISDNAKDKNKYVDYKNDESGHIKEGIPKNDLEGNQFVWIPCDIKDYKKEDWKLSSGDYARNALYDTSIMATELPQIEKYGGFYIGRYEAGKGTIEFSNVSQIGDNIEHSGWEYSGWSVNNSNNTISGKVSSKADEVPYYHADYDTAVQMSNNMYNTDYVRSGLVTGTMWDVMMNFIKKDEENDDVIKLSSWGNYLDTEIDLESGKYRIIESDGTEKGENEWTEVGSEKFKKQLNTRYLLTTGSSEQVKKKNLYDVTGNLWTWTTEAAFVSNSDRYFMLRGGYFNVKYENVPICYRGYGAINYTGTDSGFRVALYIK